MFSRTCDATDFAGVMHCARCSLSWDVGAAENAKPACKPKADPPITFEEMIMLLDRRSADELMTLVAIVRSGHRFVPDAERLRAVSVLRAAMQLLAAVRGDRDILSRLREIGGEK